jgi:hypothetical protein
MLRATAEVDRLWTAGDGRSGPDSGEPDPDPVDQRVIEDILWTG